MSMYDSSSWTETPAQLAALSSHQKYSSTDRRPECPRLALTFAANSTIDLETETSYPITFTITREADDPDQRPCVIHWDPIEDGFGQGIMLLQWTSLNPNPGWYPISNSHNRSQATSIQPREVSTFDPCVKELTPGATISWEVPLPAVYFDSFRPRQLYQVLWVGGQIPLWDWGTLAEHENRKMNPKSPLILPGLQRHSFDVYDGESDIDDVDPLPPSPKPLLASARIARAPILSLSITGPATLSLKDHYPRSRLRYTITATLSYEADPDSSPIVFHTFLFRDLDCWEHGFRLYRKENGQWAPYEIRGSFTYHLYRYPNLVSRNVGHNEENDFHALNPGESWSFVRQVTDFPGNLVSGDTLRYCFKGAQLDWWDWGHFGDHGDTVVSIDGKVREPMDNGGRPGLIVPASNYVEFTVVD